MSDSLLFDVHIHVGKFYLYFFFAILSSAKVNCASGWTSLWYHRIMDWKYFFCWIHFEKIICFSYCCCCFYYFFFIIIIILEKQFSLFCVGNDIHSTITEKQMLVMKNFTYMILLNNLWTKKSRQQHSYTHTNTRKRETFCKVTKSQSLRNIYNIFYMKNRVPKMSKHQKYVIFVLQSVWE